MMQMSNHPHTAYYAVATGDQLYEAKRRRIDRCARQAGLRDRTKSLGRYDQAHDLPGKRRGLAQLIAAARKGEVRAAADDVEGKRVDRFAAGLVGGRG